MIGNIFLRGRLPGAKTADELTPLSVVGIILGRRGNNIDVFAYKWKKPRTYVICKSWNLMVNSKGEIIEIRKSDG